MCGLLFRREEPILKQPFRMTRLAQLVVVGQIALGALGCAVPQPRGGGKLVREVEPASKRPYWLYTPAPYEKTEATARASRRWPLVVSFHGMKPFDSAPAQALEWQEEADRYGFIVLAPELVAPDVLQQFPVRTIHPGFKSDEKATLAIMDHVIRKTGADGSAVLSTSWSSGGYMAHYMLNRHPDRFTALAVRQSNFSESVLGADMAPQSRTHPVLIINTENDFAVCRDESRRAVAWYGRNGYSQMAWVVIRGLGHERTPDMAADFFARVTNTPPLRPPTVLATRQAIDGNVDGLAFLSGRGQDFTAPRPAAPAPALASAAASPTPVSSGAPISASSSSSAPLMTPVNSGGSVASPPPPTLVRVTAGTQQQPTARDALRKPVSIYATPRTGVEPLNVSFSADCPSDWQRTAVFQWSLNGRPFAAGVNGNKTIGEPGEHVLELTVTTPAGQEHRAAQVLRVIPRLSASSAGR